MVGEREGMDSVSHDETSGDHMLPLVIMSYGSTSCSKLAGDGAGVSVAGLVGKEGAPKAVLSTPFHDQLGAGAAAAAIELRCSPGAAMLRASTSTLLGPIG